MTVGGMGFIPERLLMMMMMMMIQSAAPHPDPPPPPPADSSSHTHTLWLRSATCTPEALNHREALSHQASLQWDVTSRHQGMPLPVNKLRKSRSNFSLVQAAFYFFTSKNFSNSSSSLSVPKLNQGPR